MGQKKGLVMLRGHVFIEEELTSWFLTYVVLKSDILARFQFSNLKICFCWWSPPFPFLLLLLLLFYLSD